MHVASILAMLAVVFWLESPFIAFAISVAFNTAWTFAEGVIWAVRMERHLDRVQQEYHREVEEQLEIGNRGRVN